MSKVKFYLSQYVAEEVLVHPVMFDGRELTEQAKQFVHDVQRILSLVEDGVITNHEALYMIVDIERCFKSDTDCQWYVR